MIQSHLLEANPVYDLPVSLQQLWFQGDELLNTFLMKADTLQKALAGIPEGRAETQYPAVEGLGFQPCFRGVKNNCRSINWYQLGHYRAGGWIMTREGILGCLCNSNLHISSAVRAVP